MYRPNPADYGSLAFCVVGLLQAYDVIVQGFSVLLQLAGDNNAKSYTGFQEPPVLTPRVPLIGHLLNVLSDGSGYLRRLGVCASPTPSILIFNLVIVLLCVFLGG